MASTFGLVWAQGETFAPEDRFDRQPVVGPAGDLVLFAGFLEHRGELVSRLGMAPGAAAGMADSALAHAAWTKWGEGCVDYLYGSYALVVADPAAQSLVAIRAREGAIPIYYHQRPDRFVLATAAQAIFALGDVPRDLDDRRIADALVLGGAERTRSFFRGIAALPLGQRLKVDRNAIDVRPCAARFDGPDIRFARDSDYVDAASELLRDAIASAMRATATPAAALSGGYDSAAVVVGALDHLSGSEPLLSFTAVPEPGWDGVAHGPRRIGDESGHVRALAAMYPALDARFVDAAGAPFDRDLDAIIALAEAPPVGMANLTWSVELNRAVAASGRSALLVGASGNGTLSASGRARYPQLLRSGRWATLAAELRAAHGGRGMHAGAWSQALRPLLPAAVDRAVARMRGQHDLKGFTVHSPIHPDFARDFAAEPKGYAGFASPRAMMLHIAAGGAKDQGQGFRHAMQTLTGVAARDPLGDRKILQFCLGLPPEQFLDRGEDRRLIRRMMAGRLPDAYFAPERGRQGADWHVRITRDLPRYRAEVECMADDADLSRRFDVARLRRLLDTWPAHTPRGFADHPDYLLALYGLGRALAMARFILWARG
ncbi:MAG: hypothetical protein HEQ22_07535 [Sphingopyxis sp.]|uniref:asparagine synthase-related protein n=1 Tax=Sphingopyxis sp. TaxID=1908224 RepID=UPI003D80C45B